jgi:hypothetical protein
MSSRFPVLVAGVFVVAAAAGSFFTPEPSCATTGGCLIPTFAVSQYLSVTGSAITGDLSSNVKRCKEQCDEMLHGCDGVVDAAVRCVRSAADAQSDAQKRGCMDLGSGGGDCKKENRNDLKGLLGFLDDDAENASNTCDSAREECRAGCEGLVE